MPNVRRRLSDRQKANSTIYLKSTRQLRQVGGSGSPLNRVTADGNSLATNATKNAMSRQEPKHGTQIDMVESLKTQSVRAEYRLLVGPNLAGRRVVEPTATGWHTAIH